MIRTNQNNFQDLLVPGNCTVTSTGITTISRRTLLFDFTPSLYRDSSCPMLGDERSEGWGVKGSFTKTKPIIHGEICVDVNHVKMLKGIIVIVKTLVCLFADDV